ncbi:MAG: methyltransferase domain-containing protein [Proteobacteria bacterium]|nr:methyltransferase domain-containing protein [Pseudomonadota bacterium]
MWVDVLRLRDWYRTRTGCVAAGIVNDYLHKLWPPLHGRRVLSLGFGLPYLEGYQDDPFIFAAMPAQMGVLQWPANHESRTLMTWEAELPFADDSFDYVLLTHALEFSGDPDRLLAELFRVLRADGRLLIVVPNRLGVWSRREITPFARGRPYSSIELNRLFRRNNFMVTQSVYGLFVPPTRRRWVLKHAKTFEKIGQRWHPPVGGLLLVEGRKEVYGGKVVRVKSGYRRNMMPIPATEGGF